MSVIEPDSKCCPLRKISCSDGSSEDDIEALAESELANLNLDLGNSDNSDGYMDEVRGPFS
jgi:hypothetical protein